MFLAINAVRNIAGFVETIIFETLPCTTFFIPVNPKIINYQKRLTELATLPNSH